MISWDKSKKNNKKHQLASGSLIGLVGEQGQDELRCEHVSKCDAIAMKSLVSEIVLPFYFNVEVDS